MPEPQRSVDQLTTALEREMEVIWVSMVSMILYACYSKESKQHGLVFDPVGIDPPDPLMRA
jgi:hypothetical protein